MTKYLFIQRLQNSPLTSWLWRYWQHEDTGYVVMRVFWKRPKGYTQISRKDYVLSYMTKEWADQLIKELTNHDRFARNFFTGSQYNVDGSLKSEKDND
jgi:hypothetical protein